MPSEWELFSRFAAVGYVVIIGLLVVLVGLEKTIWLVPLLLVTTRAKTWAKKPPLASLVAVG